MTQLVLSIFPGVGLLDRAFEAAGCCVVRGPDLLWGGDVRLFSPPAGVIWGVIGGPPCQDFSALRRSKPTGYGREMLAEFARIVRAAEPEWYLLENVARVPDVRITGYHHQRFSLNQGWWDPVSRLRVWQYGCLSLDRRVDPPLGVMRADCVPAALACDGRPWELVRSLQGLSEDYDLPGMTTAAKIAAVGNGVPQSMGRAVARAVLAAWGRGNVSDVSDVSDKSDKSDKSDRSDKSDPSDRSDVSPALRCACGCGRVLTGRRRYAGPACRKRAERRRSVSRRSPPV